MYDPQKNVTQLKNPWDSPRRGASTKLRPFGDFDASYYWLGNRWRAIY
jgi:hypothetical protein